MRLNSKVTWGLAWTGLAVVLAVPSADFFTGQFGQGANKAAVLTSTVETAKAAPAKVASAKAAPAKATKTATVTTKVTKDGVTIVPSGTQVASTDAVDSLLRKGKPLPDYISGDAPTEAATPTEIASLDPAPVLVAPKPFPGRPLDLIGPTRPAATPDPVVVDESELDSQQALIVPTGPVPPTNVGNDGSDPRLTQYLSNNGLLDSPSADRRSSASVTVVKRRPADYDPDGFYLSDGPNSAPERGRRGRLRQQFEDDDQDFADFTLF